MRISTNTNYKDDYVVFDIETSGLNPSKDKIIEIGAIKYKDNKEIDRFSYLINPHIKLSEIVKKVTNIKDEELEDKKDIEEVLPLFLEFIKGYTIIGHNVNFDIDFINHNAKKINKEEIKNEVIDTLFLSRINIYNIKNHRLITLKEYFNLDYNSHRAIDDCLTTKFVYDYCKERSKK